MTMELANYAVRQCRTLYRLSISELKEDVDIKTLFRALEEHGHNITELELFNVSLLMLTDSYVESCHLLEMPTVLGRLTSLKLAQYGNHVATVEMQTLGNLCSNLRHLDLEDYSPFFCKEELNLLFLRLKDSLISLKLNIIPDEHQDKIKIESSPFIHCRMLEKLWLKGDGSNAKDIMAIGQLVTLKELKFEMPITGIAEEDYQTAFEQQQLNCLHHLELHGNN
jgi:hypothetical protein